MLIHNMAIVSRRQINVTDTLKFVHGTETELT